MQIISRQRPLLEASSRNEIFGKIALSNQRLRPAKLAKQAENLSRSTNYIMTRLKGLFKKN